uniref:Uncharacterized protein n=1 Tax=Panagrolaimus sp. JU765 TaxID=591449 RepID=A0AC34RQ98_9BILA
MKFPVSLDDLIQGALQFVKPIFDTSQPLKTMNSMSRAVDDSPVFEGRQQAALGIQKENAAFKDAPICRGNSQICKFIACAAHNFKHDENFANLNLATQLISDKKLRKTITK